jgi:5-oxoprolinase (ATP-hydrolysing) subunit A
MLSIDLNCDLGECCADDDQIMPFISSANIACGYHAGDEQTIERTIKSALQNNVAVGAHPSFFDKENFGRKEFLLPEDEYYKLVVDQLDIFQKIAKRCGAKLHHVKPHGALYNVSVKNKSIANIIAKAVTDFDKNLILYGLSGSYSISEAEKYKLKTASEVFADRTYQNDGSLTQRGLPNALINSVDEVSSQVLQMIKQQTVLSADKIIIPIKAETICIHGDGEHAVDFAKQINNVLNKNKIALKSIEPIL